jgi:four helix bundle protein
LKKKTPNAQHRTSNAEHVVFRLSALELPNARYGTRKGQTFDLEDRLLEFAVEIIDVTDALPNTRAANHVAGQLLRSGTSPYGNHGEVESAESRKDFVHKLKVCLKELRETRRWLPLVGRLKGARVPANLSQCIREAEELIRIFVASIRTVEKNEK